MIIKPLGSLILATPTKKETYFTETNIQLVENDTEAAEVVEYSSNFEGVYKKGDIILHTKERGHSQQYNGKLHLFLNGKGYPDGDVWAIIGNANDK